MTNKTTIKKNGNKSLIKMVLFIEFQENAVGRAERSGVRGGGGSTDPR